VTVRREGGHGLDANARGELAGIATITTDDPEVVAVVEDYLCLADGG
jgi:hypothetical protein